MDALVGRGEAKKRVKEPPPTFSVSVVIPLFNKGPAIERTILSVCAQARRPDELIIVDDGSTDDSAAVATAILSQAAGHIDWRVISQQNRGVSAARNRGAAEARSSFIAFLDADDEWLPDYLAEVEKLAVAFPAATILSTRNATTDGAGAVRGEPTALPADFFGILDRPLALYRRGRGIFHSSSVSIRRDAWEKCDGFPVGAPGGEDIYLWLKLCMSETMAHRGAVLSLKHVEHSTLEYRKGLVPYHFHYFLGTEEGRPFLKNADLLGFLGVTLPKQIAGRRLIGDKVAPAKLRRLAARLPLWSRLKCWTLSLLPLWILRGALELSRRGRNSRI